MCWSAASTVSTVITVLTSTPGIPPGMPGWSWALVLTVGLPGPQGVPACQGGAGPPARKHARQDGPASAETVQRWPGSDQSPAAGAQTSKGRERELAIMPGRQLELGTHAVERVTGIEPALSAWESHRSGSLTALTWASDTPLTTVVDRAVPELMARQWPAAIRQSHAAAATGHVAVGLPAAALCLNARSQDGACY